MEEDHLLSLYMSAMGRMYIRDQLEIFMKELDYKEWVIAGKISNNLTEQNAIRSALIRWIERKQDEIYENYPSRNLDLNKSLERLLMDHETTRQNMIVRARQDFYSDHGISLSRFILGNIDNNNAIHEIELGIADMSGVFQVAKPYAMGGVRLECTPDDGEWRGWSTTPDIWYFTPSKCKKFLLSANFSSGIPKNKERKHAITEEKWIKESNKIHFIDLWLGVGVVRSQRIDLFMSSSIFPNIKRHDHIHYSMPKKEDTRLLENRQRSLTVKRMFTESFCNDSVSSQMVSAHAAGYMKSNKLDLLLNSPENPVYVNRIKKKIDDMFWSSIS